MLFPWQNMILNTKMFIFCQSFGIFSLLISVESYGNENKTTDFFDYSLEDLVQITIFIDSFYPETILDTAASTSVISQQNWQDNGARRLKDVINTQPSTQAYGTLGGGDAIAIRGFTSELSVRGIATLLDGMPINSLGFGTAQYNNSFFGLSNLQQVEFIRGPGSTLYGSDAFHGVMALHSFSSEQDKLFLASEVSDRGYYDVGVNASSAINSTTRINISASGQGQKNQHQNYRYTDPTSLIEENSEFNQRYDTQTLFSTISLTPNTKQKFTLGLYWNQVSSDEFPGVGRHFFSGLSLNQDRDYTSSDNNFSAIKTEFSQKLNESVSVEWKSFYWRSHTQLLSDNRRSFASFQEIEQLERRFGSRLLFKQAALDSRHQWVAAVGIDHTQVDEAPNRIFGIDGSLIREREEAFEDLEREVSNAFFQAKTAFFQRRWFLVYGARWDHYPTFGNQITPRAGIIHRPNDNSALKLLYGNAFRAAVGGELRSSALIKGNPNIDPETIDTYQFIAIRQNKTYKIEWILFASQWKDSIITVPTDDPDFAVEYANAGKNTASGSEVLFEWQRNQWRYNASASYTDSHNSKENFDYVAFPRWIINLGIGYDWRQADTKIQLNNRINDHVREGKIIATIPDPAPLGTYWRTDLSLIKKLNSFKGQLTIRNLFNRDNYLPSIWNTENGIPDESITISLRISQEF